MDIHKLKIEEHHNTKKLWELVFKEDTNSFLNYYYQEKANENEIYIAEQGTVIQENTIQGMLHLNPYEIVMGRKQFIGHYIVAVATHPNFRKQGVMRSLLSRSTRDMYERGEAFTFLMPAKEAIYLPFDFRFVYTQRQGIIQGRQDVAMNVSIREATNKDCQMLAEFANDSLQGKDIYVKRSDAYYQCLIQEMKSENGGIIIIEENNQAENNLCIGFFLYAKMEEYLIREPLVRKGKEKYLEEAIYLLTNEQEQKVRCIGYEGEMFAVEEKPMIMFRILRPELVLEEMKAKKDMELSIAIKDPMIEENNKTWKICAKQGEYLSVSVCAGTADIHLSIADLTSILFGSATNEKLTALCPLANIFLNEVV